MPETLEQFHLEIVYKTNCRRAFERARKRAAAYATAEHCNFFKVEMLQQRADGGSEKKKSRTRNAAMPDADGRRFLVDNYPYGSMNCVRFKGSGRHSQSQPDGSGPP